MQGVPSARERAKDPNNVDSSEAFKILKCAYAVAMCNVKEFYPNNPYIYDDALKPMEELWDEGKRIYGQVQEAAVLVETVMGIKSEKPSASDLNVAKALLERAGELLGKEGVRAAQLLDIADKIELMVEQAREEKKGQQSRRCSSSFPEI